jgi:hypothetical protein
MQRTFIYFAAFAGVGTVFAATLLVVGLILHNEHSHGLLVPPGMDGVPVISQAGCPAWRVVHVRVHAAQRRIAHVSQPLHGRGAGTDGPAGRVRGGRPDSLGRAFGAYHCHILTHAEGPDGMFGMVTALIVEE